MKKMLMIFLIPGLFFGAAKLFSQPTDELQKSCNMGDMAACEKLGDVFYKGSIVKKDLTLALDLYSKACKGGNQSACVSLAHMYDTGEGVAEDLAKAVQLYTKACDAGYEIGCKSIRVLYNLGKDVAFESHTIECNNGNSDACLYLGLLTRFGNKINVNKEKVPKALEIYSSDCEKGEASGCYFMGVMYENGNGVKKDNLRASELYKKACKLGYQNACEKNN